MTECPELAAFWFQLASPIPPSTSSTAAAAPSTASPKTSSLKDHVSSNSTAGDQTSTAQPAGVETANTTASSPSNSQRDPSGTIERRHVLPLHTALTQFPAHESDRLELKYTQWLSRRLADPPDTLKADWAATRVTVGSDQLLEVDIQRRLLYPIYWPGPAVPVVRGTWFLIDSSGRFQAVDENLAGQIEDGYQKFQPWKFFPDIVVSSGSADSLNSTDEPASTVAGGGDSSGKRKVSAGSSQKYYVDSVISPSFNVHDTHATTHEHAPAAKLPTFKWSLFGPYSSSHVVYSGHDFVWLLNESMASKLTQAIYSRLSYGENLGGYRIVRGLNNVEKFLKKAAKATASSSGTVPAKQEVPPTEDEKDQVPIRHLILATHGIGQKLGDKTSYSFSDDIQVFRDNIKHAYGVLEGDSENSIMVLPIEWRTKLAFDAPSNRELDKRSDGGLPNLSEITLDGISMWRSLISDALVDVLLYMEAKHRHDMIASIIREMNRVWRIFIKHHPSFLSDGGKVHLYAHSLGSLLCLDAVSSYNIGRAPIPSPQFGNLPSPESRSTSPVDLSDLTSSTRVGPSEAVSPVSITSLNTVRSKQHQNRTRRSSSTPIGMDTLLLNSRQQASEVFEKQLVMSKIPFLEFRVNNFFAVGSPIGLFLLIKEKRMGMPYNVMLQCYQSFLEESTSSPVTSRDQMTSENLQKAREWISALETKDKILHPDVDALYHLFHPLDAIAYRMEPFICRTLAESKPEPIVIPTPTRPSIVSRAIKPKSIPISFRWAESIMGYAMSWKNSANNGSGATAQPQAQEDIVEGEELEMKASRNARRRSDPSRAQNIKTSSVQGQATTIQTAPTSPEQQQQSQEQREKLMYQKGMHPRSPLFETPPAPKFQVEDIVTMLNPNRRIDFCTQSSMLDIEYYRATSVHFGYWKSEDCGLFVVKELMRDNS
eukprot:Partr_v1_DN28547_c2_g2_i1_m73372 putative DDHD domain containing